MGPVSCPHAMGTQTSYFQHGRLRLLCKGMGSNPEVCHVWPEYDSPQPAPSVQITTNNPRFAGSKAGRESLSDDGALAHVRGSAAWGNSAPGCSRLRQNLTAYNHEQ